MFNIISVSQASDPRVGGCRYPQAEINRLNLRCSIIITLNCLSVTPSVNVDDFEPVLNHLNLTLVLPLMLTLAVNNTIKTNVFLPSVNASVNPRVNADTRCKYTFNGEKTTADDITFTISTKPTRWSLSRPAIQDNLGNQYKIHTNNFTHND